MSRRDALGALLAGVLLGLAMNISTIATSRPASEPSPTDLRPVVVPTLAEAPQATSLADVMAAPSPSWTQPVMTAESSGVSPFPAPATALPSVPETIITGTASWYCKPSTSPCTVGYPASGLYAAAGPTLRVGAWRGRWVTVNGLRVRLIDWCQCPSGRIIDLYASVFGQLAPLSRGTITVTVRWN